LAGREHGDDLIGAGHAAEGIKEGEEEADGEADDEDLRKLGEIEIREDLELDVGLDEIVSIAAEIEHEPDGKNPSVE